MRCSKGCNSVVGFLFYFFVVPWAGAAPAGWVDVCIGGGASFQCQIEGGGVVALCSQYAGGQLIGVQYRFSDGKGGGVIYPVSGYTLEGFKYNHFIRYQTEYKLIKFSMGGGVYSLYSNYDGQAGEGAGVVVSDLAGKQVSELQCGRVDVNNLEDVIYELKCDAGDALGCGQ